MAAVAPSQSVRPTGPDAALSACFHDPITARRASTAPPQRRLTLPPDPVLLVLEAQRRPSRRPSIAPSPSIEPVSEPVAPRATIPWFKVAVASLPVGAVVALASWLFQG